MRTSIVGICWLIFISQSIAQTVPQLFTYQGRLFADDGITPINATVDFKFQILDPSGTCSLYEEQQSSIAVTNGFFNLSIGSAIGSPRRLSTDPGLAIEKAFSNAAEELRASGSVNCVSGYTPASGDIRRLKVTVYNQSSGVTTVMSPMQEISVTPYAIIAETLGGKKASDFLSASGSISQSKLSQVTSDSFFNKLVSVINGQNFAADHAAPAAGELVTKNYCDGKIAGLAAPSFGSASGKYLRYTGSAWEFADPGSVSAPVSTVAGRSGAVTLATSDISGLDTALAGKVLRSKMSLDCSASQTVQWISATDTYQCQNIALSSGAVTGLATSATTNTTDASNITSGVIDSARFASSVLDALWTEATGNFYRLTGKVGIGTNDPKVALHVNGEIKLDGTSNACDANKEGAQRYNTNTNDMEFCDGTDWKSMSAGTGGGGGGGGSTPANWDQTVLLVRSDYQGSDLIIADYSKYRRNPQPMGSLVHNVSEKKFGTHSIQFDGGGDGIEAGVAPELAFGSNDFTIEFQFKTTTSSGQYVLLGWNRTAADYAMINLFLDAGHSMWIAASNNNSSWTINTNTGWTPTANVWYHLAVVRSGSTLKVFVDGVSKYTGTLSGGISSNLITQNRIGVYSDGSNYSYVGFIDEIRVINGAAIYSDGYTLPTQEFESIAPTSDPYISNLSLLIHADGSHNGINSTFFDSSASQKAVTRTGDVSQSSISPFPVAANMEYSKPINGGSAYFDGTGDWLSLADHNDLDFGTGDYTIEFWMKPTDSNTYVFMYDHYYPQIARYSDGRLIVWTAGSGGNQYSTTTVNNTGSWYHIAMTRESSLTKVFINGAQEISFTDTSNIDSALPAYIGRYNNDTSHNYKGYLSNFHIIKGHAKYTAPFTPPSSLAPAHANTVALLDFADSSMRDETSKHNLNIIGDTKLSSTQAKFGGTSMIFDGNADGIQLPVDTSNSFHMANHYFTGEAWVYPTAFSDTGQIFFINGNTSGYAAIHLAINTSGKLVIFWSTNGSSWAPGSTQEHPTALSLNTWHHVAVVRGPSGIQVFLNGIGFTPTSQTLGASSLMTTYTQNSIGLYNNNYYYFNGYMDEIRITRGTARYSGNFTVPTTSFPNK
jgi:hypothetical protein